MIKPADLFGFMREHRYAHAHLSAYIDGELTAADARRIERHTSWCPHCRRLLDGLQRTVAGLRSLNQPRARHIADGVINRLRDDR